MKCLDNKREGYFIDIGAHDGTSSNNTYLLERDYGWSGVCVEPNPFPPLTRVFTKLQARRSCMCVHAAVFSSDGEVDFQVNQRHDCSGIVDASFHGQAIDEGENLQEKPTIIKVKSITPTTLFKFCNCSNIIDYISIDTEGSEYEILRVFPFNDYKVSLFQVEHNAQTERDIDIQKRDNIRNLLTKHSYRLFNDPNEVYQGKGTECEDWFIHNDLKCDL